MMPSRHLLLAVLLLAAPAFAADDPIFIGKVRNFSVSPNFYPPPNERQMKSQLRSEEAQPISQNRFLVTGMRLETFKPTGEREMLVETPGCIYDAAQQTVESTNELKVASADGKFALEGNGFYWQATNSVLFISNNVRTRLDSTLFAEEGVQVGSDSQPILIQSDTFEYQSQSGIGKFAGHLQVTGTNLNLTAERLLFLIPFRERQLQEIRAQENVRMRYQDVEAQGGEAIYYAARGTAEVLGSPRWQGTEHEGSADRIRIERDTRVLRADGNGRLRMAGHALTATPFQTAVETPAPGATNRFIAVSSDQYEFHTNRAIFRGAVQVRDEIAGQPQGSMSGDEIELAFAGRNNFERLTARGNVRIEQPEVTFRAGRADYTGTNGILVLSDNPRWIAGERSGSATVLRLDSNRKEMAALGSACLHLPASEVASVQIRPRGPGETPRPPALDKTAVATLCSDDYFLNTAGARFERSVRIDHPQLNWSSDRLQVDLPPGGGRVEKMVADGSVRFILSSENGQQLRGRGERAEYSYRVTPLGTNDFLYLTGDPVLSTTNGTFRGNVIMLDVSNQRLVAPEAYRMEAPAGMVATNLLRLPQNKILR